MHSMFVFLLWCKLIHVGILHVKVGWCGRVIQTISLDNAILFLPAQLAYSFPTLGICQRTKDMQLLMNAMPGRSMQITPGYQTERFETSPCLRGKKMCWVHWTFFVAADFYLQFFSRDFSESFSNRLHKHAWEQMHGPLFCLNAQAVAWPLRKVAQCVMSTIGIIGVRINNWKYLFDKGA